MPCIALVSLSMKAGDFVDKTEYRLVLDDTLDIGKEPAPFKNEEDEQEFMDLLSSVIKEFDL